MRASTVPTGAAATLPLWNQPEVQVMGQRMSKVHAWRIEANERLWLAYVRHLMLKGRSSMTVLNYFKTVSRLDQQVVFTQATRIDLEEFFSAELGRVSVASVNNAYAALRAFYRWLVAEDFIANNPMARIQVPVPKPADPRVVPDADIRSLLDTCKSKSFVDRRDEALIRLMTEPGGPRLGEIYDMSVADVDWRNQLVSITGKTGSRIMPYGAKTANALERYLILRESQRHHELPALWICSQGQLGYYSFRAMLVRRCKRAGVEVIHPHLLRHAAADKAMAAGISDLDMMTLFGWSSPAMLAVYGRSNRVTRAIESARSKKIGDRF